MNHCGLRLLLSAVGVLVVAGCTDVVEPAALSPDLEVPHFSTSAQPGQLDILATYSTRPSLTIAWAKKWIGPEGGRLDFQGFSVVVPSGAVSKTTQFSIHLPVDPRSSERVLAKFGPHGATFATPVRIEFPYAGTSIEGSTEARVVWWNPDASAWVDMGGSISPAGRLSTETTHFSEYGTTDGRGGVITASGG
jgi:hypothetical protein